MVHSLSLPHSLPASRWLTPVALLVGFTVSALTAHAEPTAQATKPDPLDSKAGVPTVTYESSFTRYLRLGDEKPVSWREANDTVTRIGGWRVYAREAQQPEPAPTAKPLAPMPAASLPEPAKPMPMLVPQGHGGHKMP